MCKHKNGLFLFYANSLPGRRFVMSGSVSPLPWTGNKGCIYTILISIKFENSLSPTCRIIYVLPTCRAPSTKRIFGEPDFKCSSINDSIFLYSIWHLHTIFQSYYNTLLMTFQYILHILFSTFQPITQRKIMIFQLTH